MISRWLVDLDQSFAAMLGREAGQESRITAVEEWRPDVEGYPLRTMDS